MVSLFTMVEKARLEARQVVPEAAMLEHSAPVKTAPEIMLPALAPVPATPIATAPLPPLHDVDLLKPDSNGIVLNEQQRQAVATALQNQFSVLIGYAGTGKTTTEKRIVQVLTANMHKLDINLSTSADQNANALAHLKSLPSSPLPFAMCAYTGMAVKQMRRAVTSRNDDYNYSGHCYTIHKLLDYAPVEEEVWDEEKGEYRIAKLMLPRKTKHNKLHGLKLLIIDEVSMLGDQLAFELFEALPSDCRVIAVGDLAQLPPVFGRPIMPLILSKWPITELTKIYRQEEGSLIDNANRIRVGEKPIFNDVFRGLSIAKKSLDAQTQIVGFFKQVFANKTYDPVHDIILVGNNTGEVGQEKLNVLLRPTFNPTGVQHLKQIKTMRNTKYLAVGDRVMCTKNNHEKGIYNGMLGWITDIRVASGMTMHDAAGNLIENKDEISIDLQMDLLLSGINKKQQQEREFKKFVAMVGDEETASRFVSPGLPKDDEDEGTSERKASHIVTVNFDSADFDDDGNARQHLVELWTSGELENLIPAWCTTVHKAQGSGFRNVFIVLHDSAGRLLRNELLYTAVTRCTQQVTILTTQSAMHKCINKFTIDGKSLDEKVTNYLNLEEIKDNMFKYESVIPNASKI